MQQDPQILVLKHAGGNVCAAVPGTRLVEELQDVRKLAPVGRLCGRTDVSASMRPLACDRVGDPSNDVTAATVARFENQIEEVVRFDGFDRSVLRQLRVVLPQADIVPHSQDPCISELCLPPPRR